MTAAAQMPHGQVTSEVGTLNTVLVHRPGEETRRLSPSNKDHLLFDDVIWTERAQEEHDAFVEVLGNRGVQVHNFQDLLMEYFASAQPAHCPEREGFLSTVLTELDDATSEVMSDVAMALDAPQMALIAVAGLTAREFLDLADSTGHRRTVESSLPLAMLQPGQFLLQPLPNHLFMRDSCIRVGDRLYASSMFMKARRREPANLTLTSTLENLRTPGIQSLPEAGSVEGGDVMVVSEECVLIGVSERTDTVGAADLGRALLRDGVAQRVEFVALPQRRSFMHLDTVVSMVDESSFVAYAGLGEVTSATMTLRGGDPAGGVHVQNHETSGIYTVLQRTLGADGPQARVIAAEQDEHAAEREQWEDGCNLLAISPGVVVAYERNVTTNEHLRDLGVEVLEIPGGELGRGRGGPHCMSNPVDRAPLRSEPGRTKEM